MEVDKTNVKKKKTQGRCKIKIEKIENNNHRHVAFSKRRHGIVKKASELCILCGAQIAVIVESYGGKHIFPFGHPSVDAVVDGYLSSEAPRDPPSWPAAVAAQQYRQVWQELEAEKEKAAADDGESGEHWWDLPIDEMSVEELQEYVAALEDLKDKSTSKVDELESAEVLMNDYGDGYNYLLANYDESAYYLGYDQN